MYSLKVRDFLKGLILGVGTPVLYALQGLIPNWNIDPILKIAISAAVAYLLKNFFTDDVKVAQKIVDENATKVAAAAPKDEELNPPK